MSRESKLAKNTLILAIGTFLPKLATFITLPILTGCLTKEEYGTYDLITILVSLILPSTTMQIQTAAFRFLIEVRENKDKIKNIVSTIYIFILPISIVSLLILFLCLPGNQMNVKIMICLYLFADIIVNATRQMVRGLNKNIYYSISAIVSSLGKMVFALVFVMNLNMGLFGAVTALFGASTASLVVICIQSKILSYLRFEYFSKQCLKDMLSYSWPMIPNSMSMWVMRVSDRFVVTLIMGPAANAIYSVANKIPSLLTLAQTTFTMAWQENASIYSKDNDIGKYYSAMLYTMVDLIAGFFGVLIAATPLLFKLLIKGDYSEAYNQIPILFLGMFFYSISSFFGGIYVAYKATKSVGITTLVSAVINLAVNFALIKFIGLYAASISTLVSYVFLFLFRAIDIQKIIKLKIEGKHTCAVVFIMFAESVLCFMQNIYMNIINILIAVVVFVVLNRSLISIVVKKILSLLPKRN